ncbi:acyl-CoA dehydrogenase family protein [Mycobacterium arosiense]|uniref:Acyl-CoA dehydrogenase n=1 Tax=Mycobacterium arosiense ATCC BAA-1401 = DSM 45069 TaxID=1265311 RepID=A0A1W9ZQ11_MYCAI|nr:acyl-CoA dehydrogenase family protein [Mycobacterium arosiense]ORA19881.1 acyl-CoA dehydrogenase [Mycobacterium arosiense ATCC BAA-1401 = DSM 45069]
MDFCLSGEQEQLADAERAWLERHDPIAKVRESLDKTVIRLDRQAAAHAADSGLLGLLTAGVGGTHMDLAVCSEAHGYAASSLPIADLAIGRWVLERAEIDAPEGAIVGVARVAGQTTHPVPMAADMDSLVAVREADDGDFVALVANPPLVSMTTLDLTRSWTRLDLGQTALQWAPAPAGCVDRVRAALALHRALDALGGAARLLEMTVAYAGQREQFGALIGSFQAVKHHCSDMAVGVEAGRSTLWAAAFALDNATKDVWKPAVSAAAAYVKSATSRVASTALQVHGGIGFTWEHDLHLFLRRIKVDEAFDGTVAEHRAALVPA